MLGLRACASVSTALTVLVAGRLLGLPFLSNWMLSKMLLCLPVLKRNVSLLHKGKTTNKSGCTHLLVLPTLTWLLCLQVIKYTAPEMSHLFETALGAWEVAAAAVHERQR